MDDIVKRLDEARRLLDGDVDEGWLLEAADEIVSLRARLAEADMEQRMAICERDRHYDALADSRERVQRRLAEAEALLREARDWFIPLNDKRDLAPRIYAFLGDKP